LASNNYLEVLGVTPVLGRSFLADDGNVVILGHALWRDRFRSDPQVLGRNVVINSHPFTIVGVLPASSGASFSIGAKLRTSGCR
jgi:hypothetical protein